MAPDDEREFVLEAERSGGYFIPTHSQTSNPPRLVALPTMERNFAGVQVLIVPQAMRGKLVSEWFEPRKEYFINKRNSPVIEFTRSILGKSTIHRGTIWAQMRYEETIPGVGIILGEHKGNDFEDFYNHLARWIRRHFKRDPEFGFYCGPAACELRNGGKKV